MHRGSSEDHPSPEELVGRIRKSLLTLFRSLCSLHQDASLYHHYHAIQKNGLDGVSWNELDQSYTMYEEQSNNCRRLWMKLRAWSEQPASMKATDGLPAPMFPGRSPSPLEYESDHGEDEPVVNDKGPAGTHPMGVGVHPDIPFPPTPAPDPTPPKPQSKKDDVPAARRVTVTPSGLTSCRLAPIPKGTKLSIETTRNPTPKRHYVIENTRELVSGELKSQPLNRTKQKQQGSYSSQNSLQSSGQQAGASTVKTSVSTSPSIVDYISAQQYWKPRRAIRPTDFQMDDDRRINSLDCLGPPFPVDMGKITHNSIPGTQYDVKGIYGGGPGIIPKFSSRKLANHGFDGWMAPNIEFHPFLPPKPGWPGLILRLDDGIEQWQPKEGSAFRVVIKKEPSFVEYVGQYEMVRLGDVTGDEWEQQPAKVRSRWADVLGGGQSGYEAIARVSLRKKLDKEPSIEELMDYTNELNSYRYSSMAKGLKEDIDRAFRMGDEIIAVWGMKCVGYDWNFEHHLAHSLNNTRSPSQGPSRKRKIITDDSFDEEEEDTGSDDSPPSKRQR